MIACRRIGTAIEKRLEGCKREETLFLLHEISEALTFCARAPFRFVVFAQFRKSVEKNVQYCQFDPDGAVVVAVLDIRSVVDVQCNSSRLAFGEVLQFVPQESLRIGVLVDCRLIRAHGRIGDVGVRFGRRRDVGKISELDSVFACHRWGAFPRMRRCANDVRQADITLTIRLFIRHL